MSLGAARRKALQFVLVSLFETGALLFDFASRQTNFVRLAGRDNETVPDPRDPTPEYLAVAEDQYSLLRRDRQVTGAGAWTSGDQQRNREGRGARFDRA